MILSKFGLDVRTPQGRRCIRDCQDMHRSIMRLFHCTRQEGSILYRVHSRKLMVYILSAWEPDLKDIPKGMKFIGQKDLTPWEDAIEKGQCYRFDILVSPYKKVAQEGSNNSRRRFLHTMEERMEWMVRKAGQCGFELIQIQENECRSIQGEHPEEQGGKFYCSTVSYQGILRVLDKEKFRTAWRQGIGAGKAYGQGMLLLTR